MTGPALDLRWVDVSLDVPRAQVERAAAFWAAATGAALTPWRADGRFVTVVPPTGRAVLRLQGVDDGPGGWHPDLRSPISGPPSRAPGPSAPSPSPGTPGSSSSPPRRAAVLPHADEEDGGADRPDPAGEPPVRADQLALDLPPDRAAVDSASGPRSPAGSG